MSDNQNYGYRSIIYSVSDSSFTSIINNSNSINEILRAFGLTTKGSGNRRTLKRRLIELDLNYPDYKLKRYGSNTSRSALPLLEILVENSSVSPGNIKNRVLKEGLLKYECAICGLPGTWQNQPLSLQLDHINGINTDHRLENLRILCPNCHSQTITYAGKRLKQLKSEKVTKQPKLRARKFEISKEELLKLVWSVPTTHIARQLGVSDSAIGKRCKLLGIKKPPRGFWATQYAMVEVDSS